MEAIVSDIGRYSARFGHSGEAVPDSVLHSFLASGQGMDKCIIPQTSESSTIFDSQTCTPVFDQKNGTYDPEVIEALWDSRKGEEKERAVLLVEPSWMENNTEFRQANVEYLLENRGAASISMVKDATLSCFAVGRSTGLVIDLSHHSCRVTAVTEGWVETKGFLESTCGGSNIDKYLLDKVSGLQSSSSPSGVWHARKLKHALLPHRELPTIESTDENNHELSGSSSSSSDIDTAAALYKLPDGSMISLESALSSAVLDELIEPQHAAFSPSTDSVNNEDSGGAVTNPVDYTGRGIIQNASGKGPIKVGIPRQVSHVVEHFDKDTQCSLFKGIVVCGGGAKLPNLIPRLKVSLAPYTPPKAREKAGSYSGEALQISVLPNEYSGHEAWLGGSIVASLPVFRELVVTRAQYDEIGPNIFDKRL